MTPTRPPALPLPVLPSQDRRLLRALAPLVPPAHRADWLRLWAAELWCFHHHPPRAAARRPHSLLPGILRDALWLRSEALRNALAGTAFLCLLTLVLFVALAALPAVFSVLPWRGLGVWLAHQGTRFTLESVLLVFVSYSTAAADTVHTAPGHHRRFWRRAHLFQLRVHLFQAGKVALLLLLAFLLSADLAFPWQPFLPLSADILQTTLFAIFALLGLRWSFLDGSGRCRHCLRALADPARVGRPSHNFLEWNGTELLCRDGHGRLSIPEIETSWCRSSAWIPVHPRS